ncbi:hypothetical protein BDZ97DRAFT_1792606 [Flammula alnicola]|nr:hypothetical protein BDZ97DRAFT_1792606 [Flammula alnicola]
MKFILNLAFFKVKDSRLHRHRQFALLLRASHHHIAATDLVTMTETSSMSLLRLPKEMLLEIFSRTNETKTIMLVCHALREVLYSIPSAWSTIHVGPRQITSDGKVFLSKRLERTKSCPLNVTIRMDWQSTNTEINIWPTLAEHKAQIRTFDISADGVIQLGMVLHAILMTPTIAVLTELREFSLRVDHDKESIDNRRPLDPETLLKSVGVVLPALTSLVLPLSPDCVPYLQSPLPCLQILVLDGSGSRACFYPSLHQLTQFLVQTPNLETLWCKVHGVYMHEDMEVESYGPYNHPGRGSSIVVKIPVSLPRLVRMAVTVPGYGLDLLHLIDAPQLEDLHMDGSRDVNIMDFEVQWVIGCQERGRRTCQLAPRSPALRHLAVTEVYFSRATWEWLLGCDRARGTPFPQLDSMAIHDLRGHGAVTNTFDNELLQSFQLEGSLFAPICFPSIPSPLRGNTILQMIAESAFQLELDKTCRGVAKSHLNKLREKGVEVTYHEIQRLCNRRSGGLWGRT